MDEQKMNDLIENAQTEEEVIGILKEVGLTKEQIDKALNQSDELNEEELDDVAGGLIGQLLGYYLARKAYNKIQQIRKNQYSRGYESEIMSDNRLGGTCENK